MRFSSLASRCNSSGEGELIELGSLATACFRSEILSMKNWEKLLHRPSVSASDKMLNCAGWNAPSLPMQFANVPHQLLPSKLIIYIALSNCADKLEL